MLMQTIETEFYRTPVDNLESPYGVVHVFTLLHQSTKSQGIKVGETIFLKCMFTTQKSLQERSRYRTHGWMDLKEYNMPKIHSTNLQSPHIYVSQIHPFREKQGQQRSFCFTLQTCRASAHAKCSSPPVKGWILSEHFLLLLCPPVVGPALNHELPIAVIPGLRMSDRISLLFDAVLCVT